MISQQILFQSKDGRPPLVKEEPKEFKEAEVTCDIMDLELEKIKQLIPDKQLLEAKELECKKLEEELQKLKKEEEERRANAKEMGIHCTLFEELFDDMENKYKD